MQGHTNSGTLDCYVPRVVLRRLGNESTESVSTHEGTVVFVDVSGFTKLSERLARVGREGAEQLTDAINSCFTALLADAYGHGGSLLKFGGDALLLWFEGDGHVIRGCASAAAMRSTLRTVGRIDTGTRKVVLRMSVGVHSGRFEMFLVGVSHREFVFGGPAASTVVRMEAAASAGQILLSAGTAESLPSRCLGGSVGEGTLLTRAPASARPVPAERPARPSDDAIAACLSTGLRAYTLAAPATAVPEHRTATVAFVRFGELDELIVSRGASVAAEAVEEFVCAAQEAADRYEVCFLCSDIIGGGGKLLLTAGAPRAVGDDEERMLLAMRALIEADTSLPARIGVNRGQLFAGEIGPHYRRTYTVMGDSVNLAARLMAKAPWRSIFATQGVLDRSKTEFDTTEIEPFMVKGKSRPVQAWSVGPARRAKAAAGTSVPRVPLIGRESELGALQRAVSNALEGAGTMIEIVGETGTGKSRLLAEVRELASEIRFVHATCEAYTRDVPYAGWRDPLLQLLGLSWDDPSDVVLQHLSGELQAGRSELLPWLPLLAIVLDIPVPSTPEVDQLAPEYRASKLQQVLIEFLQPALQVPTLVEIEHAHLMDEASAGLLHALADALPASTWVVIVTRRDVEDGFVASDQGTIRMELGPMSRTDAMRLAEATPEAHLVPPHLLELAVERSGGSPEFLLDLLATAASGSTTLPDSIEGAASARIDELDPGDRAVVRRAAVLGLFFHPGRLRDVLSPDAPDLDEAMWQRLAGVFARDDDGHVRFKRPALQEVAYQSLPFRLRRELHADVARSLERDVGEDVDASPAVLSLHYFLARDYAHARKHAVAGAEHAVERFAHADAARLYRRAIEAGKADGATPPELGAIWERLADALRLTGQPDAAGHALGAARRLAPDDPVTSARLVYAQAELRAEVGRLTSSVRWANRGLRTLEGIDGPEAYGLRARLASTLAALRLRQGRPREAAKLARAVLAETDELSAPRALAHACYVLDWALVELGRSDEAVNSARAIELYEQLGDHDRIAAVINNQGMFAYFRGSWDAAIELYRRSATSAVRAGNAWAPAFADLNIGEILSDQGLYEQASEYLERARRVMNATGDQQTAPGVDVLLGRLLARCGRHRDAIVLLEAGRDRLAWMGMGANAEFAALLIAESEAFGGDPMRALEAVAARRGTRDPYVPLLHRIRGVAHCRLGDRPAAIDELERSLAAAIERAADYDVASALDALETLGPHDPARAAQRDAIMERLGVERLMSFAIGASEAEVRRLAPAVISP